FRDKYLELPGDMTRAEEFWGADDNCPNSSYPEKPQQVTCNGDGSGSLFVVSLGVPGSSTSEGHRFWQHLANAGFIAGAYSGVRGPVSGRHTIRGLNAPVSKLDNATYNIYYFFITEGMPSWPVLDYRHTFSFGGSGTV